MVEKLNNNSEKKQWGILKCNHHLELLSSFESIWIMNSAIADMYVCVTVYIYHNYTHVHIYKAK